MQADCSSFLSFREVGRWALEQAYTHLRSGGIRVDTFGEGDNQRIRFWRYLAAAFDSVDQGAVEHILQVLTLLAFMLSAIREGDPVETIIKIGVSYSTCSIPVPSGEEKI